MKKKRESSSEAKSGTAPHRPGLNGLIFILILLVFCLFYNQFVTLEKLSNAVSPLARFGTIGDFLGFLGQYGARIFSGFDTFIFYLIIFLSLSVVWLEYRKKRLTLLCETLPKSDRHMVLYLALLSFVSMRYYFALGNDSYNGDAPYFFFLIKLMTQSFRNFNFFPSYTFMHGGGAPFNQFYGPLHSYTGAFFNIITGDLYLSNKITLFAFHLICVTGVYLFIRTLTDSRKAGFIAGCAAMLSYFHPHLIIFPGRYGEASIWAVYPFLFYFFEKYLAEKKFIFLLGVSISVAFAVFASIGMSYYFLLFFGFYMLFRVLFLKETLWEKSVRLLCLSGSILLGFLLASYYLYSQVFETKWSVAEFFKSTKVAGREKDIYLQLFLWNTYRISLFKFNYAWYSSYLGITLILLSLYGIVSAVRQKDRRFYPFIIMAFLILFLIAGYGRVKLLMMIPYLHTYNQPRLLNILAFMVIFLSGTGFYYLGRKYNGQLRIFLIVLILVFADLIPATFQDTAGKQYGENARPFFDHLRENFKAPAGQIPPFRADLIGRNHRSVVNNWRAYDAFVAETGIPVITEQIWDYARSKEFIQYFHDHLYGRDPRINLERFMKFYALFNTRFLLSSMGLPREPFKSYQQNGEVVLAELPEHAPVYFSSRLVRTDYSTNMFFSVLDSIRIDPAGRRMDQVPVSDSASEDLGSPAGETDLLEHSVTFDRVFMKVKTEKPVFAVLSYAAYPTIRLLVDGKETPHSRTVYGYLVVKLAAGTHTIWILPGRTAAARFFFYLPLSLFVLILAYTVYYLRKKFKKEVPS